MILAAGRVDPDRVLAAAAAMSEGETAHPSAPLRAHRDGWGAVFRARDSGALDVHRSTLPLAASLADFEPPRTPLDLMAVHARHATVASTRGPAFTHPVTRPGSPWLLLHNGYLPAAHRVLGLEQSHFDTLEYFDAIVPASGLTLDAGGVLSLVPRLCEGGTSANAFLVNPERAYVLNWFPPDSPRPDFYRMWACRDAGAAYVASEPVPLIARPSLWRPLPVGRLLRIEVPAGSREPLFPMMEH